LSVIGSPGRANPGSVMFIIGPVSAPAAANAANVAAVLPKIEPTPVSAAATSDMAEAMCWVVWCWVWTCI